MSGLSERGGGSAREQSAQWLQGSGNGGGGGGREPWVKIQGGIAEEKVTPTLGEDPPALSARQHEAQVHQPRLAR